MTSYEKLISEIKKAPVAYYPGILYETIKIARKKKCFAYGNPMPLIEKICFKILSEKKGKHERA